MKLELRHPRSPKWPAVSRAFLAANPRCAFCGRPARVAHHKRPYHVEPALELDPANLLATCGPDGDCHLQWCHLGRWDCWNPHAADDAELMHRRRCEREPRR